MGSRKSKSRSLPTKARWQTGNGFFSKRRVTMESVEADAFDELKAWAFAQKYQKSNHFHTSLSHLKRQFGDDFVVPKGFKNVLPAGASTADSISVKNKALPSDNCYRTISDKGAATRVNVRTLLDNSDIVVKAPINFYSYLTGAPSEFGKCIPLTAEDTKSYTNLWDDSFFQTLIVKSPFFKDVEAFKTAVARHTVMIGDYEERAQVYYEIANYYSQMVARAMALYNVELMTYFKVLFEQSSFRGSQFTAKDSKESLLKKVDSLSASAKNLQSGDYLKNIDKAFKDVDISKKDVFLFPPLPMPSYVSTGGFSLRRKREEEAKPFLKVAKIAQLLEVFMAEPYLQEETYDDPEKDMANTYRFDFFEPLVTKQVHTDVDAPAGQFGYIEDLRKKFLIALRECRKSMIMHEYFTVMLDPRHRSDQDELSKLQQLCDTDRSKSLAWKVNLIFADVVDQIPQKLDESVKANFISASSALKSSSTDPKALGKALVSPSLLVFNMSTLSALNNLSSIRSADFGWGNSLWRR